MSEKTRDNDITVTTYSNTGTKVTVELPCDGSKATCDFKEPTTDCVED